MDTGRKCMKRLSLVSATGSLRLSMLDVVAAVEAGDGHHGLV